MPERRGKAEGRTEGRAEGRVETLIDLTCRKFLRGKPEDVIAEELEKDPALIRRICQTARAFAPQYDTEKIYSAMQEKAAY